MGGVGVWGEQATRSSREGVWILSRRDYRTKPGVLTPGCAIFKYEAALKGP